MMKYVGGAIMLLGAITLVGAAGASDANTMGFGMILFRSCVSGVIMAAGYATMKKGEEHEGKR